MVGEGCSSTTGTTRRTGAIAAGGWERIFGSIADCRRERVLTPQLPAMNCRSHFVGSFFLAATSQARAHNLVRAGTQRTAKLAKPDYYFICKKGPQKSDSRPGINSLSYVAKTPAAQPRRTRRLRISTTAVPSPQPPQVSAVSEIICPPLFFFFSPFSLPLPSFFSHM
jgi:hypothetical protein